MKVSITKSTQEDYCTIKLKGDLDEELKFGEVIGPLPKKVIINCKSISRINSSGVKGWIAFFGEWEKKGTQFQFIECSIPVMEQMNLISNFRCGGEIVSFYLPFYCEPCQKELVVLYKTKKLKATNFKIPELKCPHCSNTVKFDDNPDEFFTVLRE